MTFKKWGLGPYLSHKILPLIIMKLNMITLPTTNSFINTKLFLVTQRQLRKILMETGFVNGDPINFWLNKYHIRLSLSLLEYLFYNNKCNCQ